MINPWDNPEQFARIKALSQARKDARQHKRKQISQSLRRKVFEAKGENCTYCGIGPIRGLDHIVPVARGGENTFDNLAPCCDSCNSKKHMKTLEAVRHA